MKLQAYHWLFAATLFSLGYATYGWGGLRLVPDIGTIAVQSAQREAALTWTYMSAGEWWIERVGWETSARHRAEQTFAELRPQLLATPAAAMDLLHGEPLNFGHRMLKWAHWGTPLLLVLGLVSWVRRQKAIVTTRRIR